MLRDRQPDQKPRLADTAQPRRVVESDIDALRLQIGAFVHRQAVPGAPFAAVSAALTDVSPTVTPLSIESRGIWRSLEGAYWTNGTGEVINSRAAPSAGWHPLAVRSQP